MMFCYNVRCNILFDWTAKATLSCYQPISIALAVYHEAEETERIRVAISIWDYGLISSVCFRLRGRYFVVCAHVEIDEEQQITCEKSATKECCRLAARTIAEVRKCGKILMDVVLVHWARTEHREQMRRRGTYGKNKIWRGRWWIAWFAWLWGISSTVSWQ